MFLKLMISLYIVFLAATTAKEMIAWTKVSYLATTPAFFLILIFVVLCIFMASTSLQTLAMVNVLLLSIILVLGHFVGISNMQFKDFSLLKPVLEHGMIPVFSGTLYAMSGGVEIIVLLFLAHKIHGVVQFKTIVINALLLVYLTMGPVIGAIAEFGPEEASKQVFPAYAEWSIISLGRFVEHMDFFSFYQWLSGSFIRVSLLMYISAEVYQIKKEKKKVFLLSFYGVLIMVFVLWPVNDMDYYALSKKIFIPLTFWFFFILSIILGCIVFYHESNEEGKQERAQKNQ
ncbi:GerAB/ArcD/ProY family transporter [Terrilactibacillus sp. S3-3]|nr:GerAB/ArcD/ProY family transporter [Terrilactibacillus sp. S3-3]